MGSGASVPSASSGDIAKHVASLGEPYEGYAQKIEADGVDGEFLASIEAKDLPDLFTDWGVTSTAHKKKLELVFKSFSGGALEGAIMPSDEAKANGTTLGKIYAGFLSHFKMECGTEARLVQQNLKPILAKEPLGGSSEVFLDSDDLSDLRNLLQHVKDTQCLVLMQSKRVLERPWVILELYTAITNSTPIVALNVENANPYSYADAVSFLMHFDEEIEIANPGAAQLLLEHGVDPVDVAYLLSDSLPNIISTSFNPNASEKVLQASLEDLVDSMRRAVPIAPTMSKEEWLEKRKAHKPSSKAHGSQDVVAEPTDGAAEVKKVSAPSTLADIPATVPALPNAYLVRATDLADLKSALLAKGGTGSTALTSKSSKQKQNKIGAHGMG